MKTKHFCRSMLCLWYRWGLTDFSVQLSALMAITEMIGLADWTAFTIQRFARINHSGYGTLWKSLASIFFSSAKSIIKCQNLAGVWNDQGKGWDLPIKWVITDSSVHWIRWNLLVTKPKWAWTESNQPCSAWRTSQGVRRVGKGTKLEDRLWVSYMHTAHSSS